MQGNTERLKENVMRTGIGLILIWTSANAFAGSTIYTCKTAAGTVFQDTPCALVGQTVTVKSYYAPPPTPAASQRAYPTSSAYTVGTGSSSNAVAATMQNRMTPQEAVANPEGYECSAGGKVWVQSTPCQSSVTTFTPMVGVGAIDGFSGPGAAVWDSPVQQQALTHEQYCESLNAHEGTSYRGKADSPSAAYERNKQRQLNGC